MYRQENVRKIWMVCLLLLLFPLCLQSQNIYRVTAQKLNVRQSPSTRAPVVGSLIYNETIRVYEINNGWAEIEYKGQRRFVSVQYIALETKSTQKGKSPKQENTQRTQTPQKENTQQGREQERGMTVTYKRKPSKQKTSRSAQRWEWDKSYLGDIHAGYNTSCKIGGYKTYSAAVILGTLQGVQLNQYLSAGIGVDAWMLTHYYSGQGIRFGMATFVDMRGYYPVKEKFSPFLDLALGADFSLKPSPAGANFYCEFGPGFRYKQLGFSCGLQHTAKKTNHFYAKLGIFF